MSVVCERGGGGRKVVKFILDYVIDSTYTHTHTYSYMKRFFPRTYFEGLADLKDGGGESEGHGSCLSYLEHECNDRGFLPDPHLPHPPTLLHWHHQL